MTDLETIRRDLLDAALTHIPFDGWTPRALAAAAGDLGLPADAAARAFPRGVADLAAYFSAEFDRRMAAELGRQEVCRPAGARPCRPGRPRPLRSDEPTSGSGAPAGRRRYLDGFQLLHETWASGTGLCRNHIILVVR